MKNTSKYRSLPMICGSFGIAALILRRMLYALATDEKGLLVPNHPLKIALWAVVLAGALLILTSVRKLKGSGVYEENFSASTGASLGHALMGCAVLTIVLQGSFSLPGVIAVIWRLLGFAAAPAMIWAGIRRKKGQQPFFGTYALVCLFLLVYLVSRYQIWSGNPQLQDYIFDLLATVALVLFSYHTAAFGAGMGKRRMQLTFGLLTILLCSVVLSGGENPILYVGGAVWAATDLCRLGPPRKKDRVDVHDPS